MGNHQSRERSSSGPHQADFTGAGHSEQQTSSAPSSRPRLSDPLISADRSSARSRSARHDLSLFSSLSRTATDIDPASPEARKETKAEREARKLKKEREAREKERERSVREENVDGGYLVTMGVYTGTEDFSKPTVRQLMIERRIAPFWQGLETWSESWTDNQIIAAAKGLSIPPPQENPPPRPSIGTDASPRSSDSNLHALNIPIASREHSYNSESSNLTPSHPAFSTTPQASSYSTPQSLSSPLFRGRAKTLASLASVSRGSSQSDTAPQELQLPKDPYVNGQSLEVALYKDPLECPICFLYYPQYLNKTRCCGHPICSECFVQIKRPDPHVPEHHADSSTAPTQEPAAETFPNEESMLVSEPATCPFCKQPELGVTYDPPHFRKGLTYANQTGHQIASVTSAMSSSSSINSQGASGHSRRRTVSLGANSPLVVTTDRIRPDWAKKLSDARAYALRRAAAATALHTAAYLFNNNGGDNGTAGPFQIGRRRRTIFGGPGEGSGPTLNMGNVGVLLAAADRQGQTTARTNSDGQGDLFPGRGSSRRTRVDDIENMMMMEAIRLSLAAEEERKKKEEKDAAKQAKKEEKLRLKEAKDAKKAGKAARKSMLYPLGSNTSSASQLTTGGESSIAGGKGKGIDRSGEDSSPNSPITTSPKDTPQRHLEVSRTNIQTSPGPDANHLAIPEALPIREPQPRGHTLRQLSVASSSGSSFAETHQNEGATSSLEPSPHSSGLNIDGASAFRSETPPGSAGLESMFNFRSLAAVIGDEHNESKLGATEHIEETTGLKTTPEILTPAPQEATPSPLEGNISSATGNKGHVVQSTASHDVKACADSTVAPKSPLSETTDGQKTS